MVLMHFLSFKFQIFIDPSPELDASKSFELRSMRKTGPVCSVNSNGSMDLSLGITLMVISSEQAAIYCKGGQEYIHLVFLVTTDRRCGEHTLALTLMQVTGAVNRNSVPSRLYSGYV